MPTYRVIGVHGSPTGRRAVELAAPMSAHRMRHGRVYTLLNQIWRVFWMTLRYTVAGLILLAAVLASQYVIAMIILWWRAHS